MAMEYTEEQLNNFDKATLVQLFLVQQSQLKDIDQKLQLLLEQVAVLNSNRFGRSSEKLDTENQIRFMEVDGNIIYFNEAEAIASLGEEALDDEDVPEKLRSKKTKGKRTADIRNLPVIPIEHKMTVEELVAEFGEDGWYQLDDEIYNRYRFTPMKVVYMSTENSVNRSLKTRSLLTKFGTCSIAATGAVTTLLLFRSRFHCAVRFRGVCRNRLPYQSDKLCM